MIISLVVAAGTNNAIGKNNQLLWHLPEDIKFFKNTTWAMPVAMGRKTFESMGGKPLSGRMNIVITRQPGLNVSGVIKAKDIDDAIRLAREGDMKELFVIGGGEIYRQAFNRANRIYLTRVHADFDADTFFPSINEKEWQLVNSTDHPSDEKHAYNYTFQLWVRK